MYIKRIDYDWVWTTQFFFFGNWYTLYIIIYIFFIYIYLKIATNRPEYVTDD